MIYLDHAAATPVSKKVFEAMEPYFSHEFFNPSAAYLPAKKVSAEYEAAKGVIAHAIGAKSHDLVITAGATEANNLAFSFLNKEPVFSSSGLEKSEMSYAGQPAEPSPSETNLSVSSGIYIPDFSNHFIIQKIQVLYLSTEHDSVRKVAEKYGGAAIDVDRNGRILLDDLKAKITDDTRLISVALVNNELGTIQPLSEIAAIIRKVRLDRLSRGVKTPLYLHSDASQAMNLLNVNVARLGVDLLTLNAAKIYGPKGVGALYVSHEVKLKPLNYGGGQEMGLRSGTENVPGVMGFAKAVEEVTKHLNGNRKKYALWRKILLDELQGYELVNKKHALDNFVVLCYNGIDAERLIFLLEDRGVYVSTGAACAASKGVKSHVLKAIGLSDSEIAGSLRITLGETNTEEQIHEAARLINEAVKIERRRR
ncbi:cysteine desulfurase [Candidatus Saccharibacteria bacterium]|nr:cysteine desulfurase [Candidatus Saccharibacteria bacterium]